MIKKTVIDASSYDDFDGHEQVVYFEDDTVGLNAVIGVHNTNLGPSFGGCRIHNYTCIEDAITDALRLSKGMTYKSALAGLPLGGGKAVIIADSKTDKSPEKIKAFGEAVEAMAGAYITAEDVGSSDQDMVTISGMTSYVSGLPKQENGLGGNPSPFTAKGVFYGMQAGLNTVFNTDSFDGVHVVVKGVGSVGYDLCRYLDEAGAKLTITDINQMALKKAQEEFRDVTIVDPISAHEVPCDILAPCALGNSINPQTLADIKAKLITGAANNQLSATSMGTVLHKKGVIYAPDYVVNAGGIIAVGYEYFSKSDVNPFNHDINEEMLHRHIAKIKDTTTSILSVSQSEKQPSNIIADRMAEEIFR